MPLISPSLSSRALVKAAQVLLLGVIARLHIDTPIWTRPVDIHDGDTFDFIIVGAGTAGSIVASRLSEIQNCSILVVEAGGDPPIESVLPGVFPLLQNSSYDWQYAAEYDENFVLGHLDNSLDLPSGKILGGSSSINHMIYSRGFPSDYNSWADVSGNVGWRYENIEKYFKKSEKLKDPEILNSEYKQYHGLDGNIEIARQPEAVVDKYLDALKELGYKVILDIVNHALAFSQYILFIFDGKRQSVAQSYILPIKDERNNLYILKNTLVTEILFDEDLSANGVLALTKDDQIITVNARKEVILSAGVFNSPKALMLSGVGPKDDLEKLDIPVLVDLPVGENFQDIMGVMLIQKVKLLDLLLPVMEPPTKFAGPGIAGFVSLNGTSDTPDYQHLSLVIRDTSVFAQICSIVFTYKDSICDSVLNQLTEMEFLFQLPSFYSSKSRGKVQLRSTNVEDKPIINANYFSEAEDVEKAIDIIEDTLKNEQSTYFREQGAGLVKVNLPECETYEYRSRDYWKCYIKYMSASHYYYTSTCSMGSVVDGDLFVKGTKKLRVVDASVIPFSPHANPETSVLIVAERAADLIKETHYSNSN